MDYIKIQFGSDLDQLEEAISQSVEDLFHPLSPSFHPGPYVFRPQVDIYESDDEIMVLSELAGVKKEDLFVEIGLRTVKIFGRRREKLSRGAVRYHLAEIPYGHFERTLSLPTRIDVESVMATFHDGLLEIRLIKKPIADIRKITIQKG